MKIKLLILSDDKGYTERLRLSLSKYSASLELYVFEEKETALECLKNNDINVFIAERLYKIDEDILPSYCAFSYFVPDSSINEINGFSAIGKYQSVDLIYKSILELYDKFSGSTVVINKKQTAGTSQKIAFTSFSGGVGTSTMAVACSIWAAKRGYKVLYLNLERIPSTNVFLSANGNKNFSEIIYAIRSNSNNLLLKLETTAKKDETSVYFYDVPEISLDMNELTYEDLRFLVKSIDQSSLFDVMVVDCNFDNSEGCIDFLSDFDNLVVIGDGSEISNQKSDKAIEGIKIYEEKHRLNILSHTVIAYNKFSNKTGHEITAGNLHTIGGAPRVTDHSSAKEILNFIVGMNFFSELFH